jgi:hypothetical protein
VDMVQAMSDLVWTNVTVKLGDLKPWSDNPRMSTKAQAKRLLASFDKFGQVQTVAIDPDCGVLDGHQRLSALLTIHGADYAIDARQSSRPLSEQERKELVISLHAGAVGGWDWEKVSGWNSADLQGWGMDGDLLKSWNNDTNNLKELLKSEAPTTDAEVDTDRAAELLEKWGCKTGDLYAIGEHRLIVGDCTDAAVVARVIAGDDVSMVTDPPYGIGYEYNEHDDSSNEANDELVRKAFTHAPVIKVWTCGLMNTARELLHYPEAKILCWHKGFAQAGSGLGGVSTWEPVLVVGAKDATLPNDYLSFSTDREPGLRELHSCPKPVALFQHLIEHLTHGDIYEPFSGSGTTLVACQNLSRRCMAIEISPAYVAVALERMSQAFPALEIKRL